MQSWWSDFFVSDIVPAGLYLKGEYSTAMVVLSVAIAVFSSVLALQVAGLAKQARQRWHRQVALLSGSVALGIGIWAMHFIGMLAQSLCVSASYDPLMTGLSVLPGIFASWVALMIMERRDLTRWQLCCGGLILGAGIGLMHYSGMSAMRMVSLLRYDAGLFTLSIAVAVGLAILAIAVWQRIQQTKGLPAVFRLLIGGSFFGLAISGMHYTGMAAARFIGFPRWTSLTSIDENHLVLTGAVAGGTVVAGFVVLAGNFLLRFVQIYRYNLEIQSRLQATVNTSLDGILTCDRSGRIISANTAAASILGAPVHTLHGVSLTVFFPTVFTPAADGSLDIYLEPGDTVELGAGEWVRSRRLDGKTFPARLAVGQVGAGADALLIAYVSDMTRQASMQKDILERERRYRTLIANIPGVVFRSRPDADWSKMFISDSVISLTGWSAADFTSGQIRLSDLIHPNDIERVREHVNVALREQRSWNLEYRILTKDGQEKWIAESAGAVFDEHGNPEWMDGVMFDISDAKRQSAEFAGIVTAIKKALVVAEFDMQGNILFVNDQFLTLTAYSEAEVVGHNHRMLCPKDDFEEKSYQTFWANLRAGRFQSGEYRRIGKHGQDVWIQAAYNPILDADGKPWKVVKLAADLSLRKNIERDLIREKERAEAASAAKGMFLANMSHEIRTPMNAILGFTEILMGTKLDAQQEKHVRTVLQSARSLLRLLNDILDTAKLERGAIELELRDCSLPDLLQQVVNTFQLQASQKGIELQQILRPEVPALIHADDLRLRQVLTNLLGNAVKFTERGSVTLTADYVAPDLILSIQDSGIGISADRIDAIFAPFTQADASMTRRFGGTGLGTTIARQLTELMGGQISVVSTQGEGSCFTVRVPVQASRHVQNTVTAQQMELPPLKILIADDVPENIELLELLLRPRGHKVMTAGSGHEAVRLFEQHTFDVVLMDVQMPDVDGLQATRMLHQLASDTGRAVPVVIALTASVLSKDRDEARQAGMLGFATKPVDLPELEKEIARVLQLNLTGNSDSQIISTRSRDKDNSWELAVTRWGSEAALITAVQAFLRRTAAEMAEHSAESGFAHRIKGAAQNLGLPEIAEVAAIAEAQGGFSESDLERLRNAIDAVHLNLLQAGEQDQADTGAEMDFAVVIDVLRQLIPLLKDGRIDAEMLEHLQLQLGRQAMQALSDAIDEFDFDLASQLAVKLLQDAEDRK